MSFTTHFASERVILLHGDALEVARSMPDGSVDCISTSPPYFGLRDYGIEGQYGLEGSPEEYVERMRELFSELRRVLADDGTLWLNLGDSYGKGKQLLGIPWRVALALQADGWILRNDVIWHKTNAMPFSGKDRLATRHEHVFMLSKSRKYWFGLDDIREPHTMKPQRRPSGRPRDQVSLSGRQAWPTAARDEPRPDGNPNGKNPGDVWLIPTRPFPEAHFAVQSPDLAERCVLAGCKPGGTVLDPFSGSGTTGMVALQHGRSYIGIELSREYLDLSLRTRFADEVALAKEATA